MPQLLMLAKAEREKQKVLSLQMFEAFASAQGDQASQEIFRETKRAS